MTLIVGIDLSTHAVDLVAIPLEHDASPVWHRYPLSGPNAFDRTRGVRDAMPSRTSELWDTVAAVGIEHPAGHHGTRDLLRVQGAILACLPGHLLVHPLPPSSWRKAAGLKGNATKLEVAIASDSLRGRGTPDWPQDAHDAHLIARATRALLDMQKQAA